LEVPRIVLILHYLACFQKGLFFKAILSKNTLGPLAVKGLEVPNQEGNFLNDIFKKVL
jgi:hypothetical protein